MGEHQKQSGNSRRYPSLMGPVLLIAVGALFLLGNLGLLSIRMWDLWRLWPVLLILAGLDLLFGRRSLLGSIFVLLVAVGVVAVIVVMLVTAPNLLRNASEDMITQISEPLGSIERVNLQIGFGAGELNVAALDDSSSAVEGQLRSAGGRAPSWTVSQDSGAASMTLEQIQDGTVESWGWGEGDRWTVELSPHVPFSLNVSTGAGDANLNLGELDIRELVLEAGVNQTTVVFPARGNISAEISGGVGGLVLEIPSDVGARITLDRGLGTVDIDSRFRKDGEAYLSDNWDSSDHRLDVAIEMGLGVVTIREP